MKITNQIALLLPPTFCPERAATDIVFVAETERNYPSFPNDISNAFLYT